MDRDTARQEIRRNWRKIITNYTGTAKKKVNGKTTYICPFCSHGKGGDGIGEIPPHKTRDGDPYRMKCFTCGFEGDILDFISHKTGADYNTALKAAADILGITIDPSYNLNALELDDKKELYKQAAEAKAAERKEMEQAAAADRLKNYLEKQPQEAPQGAVNEMHDNRTKIAQEGEFAAEQADYTAYYEKCRQQITTPAAISYLQARGINPETAARFMVGYDPAWISPTVIKNQKAKGSSWTPAPTARIILPVSKNHYIARATDPAAKYAKMNETGDGSVCIFNIKALYGDHEAVFITEGIFDALSVIECGAAAIALNSTNNADQLIRQLEKDPTKATLILCLDNDDAGRDATAIIKQGATRLNISYVTSDINCGFNDPNEALTGNRPAFEKAIRDAQAQTAARPDNANEYIDHLMQSEIERLKAAADRKTGFAELDRKTGGLYPGLYVIAATSSLGKTTFALQMADSLAAAGQDVLFFSMEQSRLELVSKSFSRILKERGDDVSSLALRKGYHMDKLQEAAAIYKGRIGGNMSIVEGNFACNISFIGDYIRRYIRRNGTSPIIFIDYLQILQPADDAEKRSAKETVDSTVTELKRISREHDLTVFIISSINRANYLAPIDFESLKESGGIEYTADVIWGLQLQCLNDPLFDANNKIKEKRQMIRQAKADTPRKIELLCLKNRYGISNFNCGFDYYPANDLFIQIDDFDPCCEATPFDKGGARY